MKRCYSFSIAAISTCLSKTILSDPASVVSFRVGYRFTNVFAPERVSTLQRKPFNSSNSHNEGEKSDHDVAKNVFNVLARRSKTWQRLSPFVDFALSNKNETLQSICDVGTDHGLLATAFSMTNRFDHVLGVDVSEQAIERGALKLYDEIVAFRNKTKLDDMPLRRMDVVFRISNGLQNVHKGEADIVCIAGMGVNTMVDILTARKGGSDISEQSTLLLDELETQLLLLQPTSSRPRYLLFLYRKLSDIGWRVRAERIEFVSSRWYFTIALDRATNATIQTPGMIANIADSYSSSYANELSHWIHHHKKWIKSDSIKKESSHLDDMHWLREIEQFNIKINDS